MCTAISYKNSYFGRTLDLEYSLGEGVIITPRHYPFSFSHTDKSESHYAIMGIGVKKDGYPLYYDAINEQGLWMAGLNFPHYAHYNRGRCNALNLASFELLPYILSSCATLTEAQALLERINVTSEAFSEELPPSPLHWMLCDSERCIVIEPLANGLSICENNVCVLTNSPPFDYQTQNLTQYLSLTPYPPASRFSERFTLEPHSRGMGAIGMPGDVSSTSRFVRAAFTLANSHSGENERESIAQFFHIMSTVAQVSGTVRLEGGKLERTQYTSCANSKKLVYYYTTYERATPTAVEMKKEDLNSKKLILYPLLHEMKIERQN